jgi:hypothetical protein
MKVSFEMRHLKNEEHTINVTQEDIDTGNLRDCYECPIAIAMRREFGMAVSI